MGHRFWVPLQYGLSEYGVHLGAPLRNLFARLFMLIKRRAMLGHLGEGAVHSSRWVSFRLDVWSCGYGLLGNDTLTISGADLDYFC